MKDSTVHCVLSIALGILAVVIGIWSPTVNVYVLNILITFSAANAVITHLYRIKESEK